MTSKKDAKYAEKKTLSAPVNSIYLEMQKYQSPIKMPIILIGQSTIAAAPVARGDSTYDNTWGCAPTLRKSQRLKAFCF